MNTVKTTLLYVIKKRETAELYTLKNKYERAQETILTFACLYWEHKGGGGGDRILNEDWDVARSECTLA